MIANGRRRWKIKNIIEGPAVLDKTHTPSSKMSENGVEYNVNLLLQYVKGEEFNVEENSYIKRVIKYVLEKLNEESKKKMDCFVNSIVNESKGSECITLSRSLVIIPKHLHVSDNTRSRVANRFVSNKMQWLCVILSRIFDFPQLTHQLDLNAVPHCHYHYMKKLESICINTSHYELKAKPIENIPMTIVNLVSSNDQMETNQDFIEITDRMDSNNDNQVEIQSENIQVYQLLPVQLIQLQQDAEQRYAKVYESSDLVISDAWASIQYNEEMVNVGNPFFCNNEDRTIVVDNGVYPSDGSFKNRFCLGSISDLQENNTDSMTTFVGLGVALTNVNGLILMDNLAPGSVFVQSWTGTEHQNKMSEKSYHRATVMQIEKGLVGICIFDLSIFAQDLDEAAIRLKRAREEDNEEDERLAKNELSKMQRRCKIRISFGQGFGEKYSRKSINSCSSWIEIKAFTALRWLDKVKRHYELEGFAE